MKDDKGFTLVELLIMIAVLGVLMTVTIPNVTGMLEQQKKNLIKEDVNKMINATKIKVASNSNSIQKPSNGNCIVFTLKALNDSDDINKGPHGGEYDLYNSYVIMKRNNSKYEYYVRLIENEESKYYGILSPEKYDDTIDITSKITESTSTDTSLNESSVTFSNSNCTNVEHFYNKNEKYVN